MVSGPDWGILRNPRKVGLTSGELYDVARSTIAATGLVAAGVAGALAYRSQRTKELEHSVLVARHELEKDESDRSKDTALRERFASAVDQLGRREAAVRVAGVYALAQTADDWLTAGSTASAQSCIDVLCSYLRMPERTQTPVISEGEAVLDPADIEVREAAIDTIARRLSPRATVSWSALHFDFTGATFTSGRYLFAQSIIDGSFTMTGVTVASNARLIFRDCRFNGGTHFIEMNVLDKGFVRFEKAKFAGRGGFTSLLVDGGSFGLVDCHFLNGSAARFSRLRVRAGIVRITNTTFESRVTDFSRMQLTGGWLTFHRSKVLRGTLNLKDAETFGDHPVASFHKFEVADEVVVGGNVTLLKERAQVPSRMSFEPRYTET